MTKRALVSLSLSALMLGGSVVGCAGGGDHVASASDPVPAANAATASDRATKALARGHADEAVRFAEQAVAADPRQAGYRSLLGQSYLKAGRFTSARQAFGDVLRLDPDDGKAALNLALAQIGLGDWAGARTTLGEHAATIPAADRGLATALAGDPVGAVEQLTAAARSPDANVKTRQNLALALALAGHWPEAKAVAATDLSPADVDKRMTQWATFARPAGAADQVSALLGVVPVVDAGQPAILALSAPAPIGPAPVEVATAAPVVAPMEAVAVAVAEPAPAAASPPVAPSLSVAAAVLVRPAAVEASTRVVAVPHAAHATMPLTMSAHQASGSWYVQIGAYRSADVAREGWARALRRDAALRSHMPETGAIKVRAGQFYRLSVGGFARGAADATCRSYRARGGSCFVRAGAGDRIAQWARKDVQLASR